MSEFKPQVSIDLYLCNSQYFFRALACLHLAGIIWKSVYKLSKITEKVFSCALRSRRHKGETRCRSLFGKAQGQRAITCSIGTNNRKSTENSKDLRNNLSSVLRIAGVRREFKKKEKEKS